MKVVTGIFLSKVSHKSWEIGFFFLITQQKNLKKPPHTKTIRKLTATQSLIKALVPASCQKQRVLLTQAQKGNLLESNKQNPPILTHESKVARTGEAYRHLTVPEKVILAAFLPKGWIQSTKEAHSSLAGTGIWSLNTAWKSRKIKAGEKKRLRPSPCWPSLQFRV